MAHILLQADLIFKKITPSVVQPKYHYEIERGAWISKEQDLFIIHAKTFQSVGTKKEEIKIGEDKK